MTDSKDDDYKTGYGKPPTKSRWKKGQSGNPNGRPKISKDAKVDIGAILSKPINVKANSGRTSKKQMLPLEAMYRSMAKKAIGGDVTSIKSFIQLCIEHDLVAPPSTDLGYGVIIVPKDIDPEDFIDLNGMVRLQP